MHVKTACLRLYVILEANEFSESILGETHCRMRTEEGKNGNIDSLIFKQVAFDIVLKTPLVHD